MNDPLSVELLTNDEVLPVNQRSTGNREQFADGDAGVLAFPWRHRDYSSRRSIKPS